MVRRFLHLIFRFYLSLWCIRLVLDYHLNIAELYTARNHGFHCQTLRQMDGNQ